MSEHSSSYQSKASTTRYTSDFSSPFPSHVEQQLHEVREYTIHQFENSRMMISETQAKLLNQLIKLVHAKRVLEIGTYTGYSAIAQAAALPPNGKMITLDINEATQAIARRYLEKAKLLDKVKLQLGPAADSIRAMIDNKKTPAEKFDFIFMDADKDAYITYYNLIMDHDLLSDDGLIVCDNVLRQGNVVRAAGYEEGTITGRGPDAESHAKAVHEFNQHVAKDTRVQAVILPLYDGMTLIRKA